MTFLGIWMFPTLFLLIALGFPIAFSMLGVSLVFGYLRFGEKIVSLMVSKVNEVGSNYVLGAIPLFILMGALLQRSGIAERLYDAVHIWTRKLPGGYLIGTIVMSTIFAASTGVAGATETVIGLLAIPAMLKYNYSKELISGTICAGGSLGTIIPPSITVIVLAPIASLPVGSLFSGIMMPGLVMAGFFLLYILVISFVKPELAPFAEFEEDDDHSLGAKLLITATALLPPVALIVVVLGSILAGWATPTEAAACGAAGCFVLAVLHGRMTFAVMKDALFRTLGVTAMIIMIVLAGSIFSAVFYSTGGMRAMQSLLNDYGITGGASIALILLLTFVAGFVLDLISVILIVIPIAMPLVKASGVDPLWFAVVFLIVLQAAYLTPPMAPSIFYLRGIAPKSITLKHMYRGVIPFIFMQAATVALVILFPGLATWLPQVLYGN